MKIAIMQPYFMPYIGYWNLIDACDVFIYYDDASFRKQSWINRNYIRLEDRRHMFTISTIGASSNRQIREAFVGKNLGKVYRLIKNAYQGSPQYQNFERILEAIFTDNEKNLSEYIIQSNARVLEYIGLHKQIYKSSQLQRDRRLRGEEAVLDMCKAFGASMYINLPGGRELYDRKSFSSQNIELAFIETGIVKGKYSADVCSDLSILDALMNLNVTEIREYLASYTLKYD